MDDDTVTVVVPVADVVTVTVTGTSTVTVLVIVCVMVVAPKVALPKPSAFFKASSIDEIYAPSSNCRVRTPPLDIVPVTPAPANAVRTSLTESFASAVMVIVESPFWTTTFADVPNEEFNSFIFASAFMYELIFKRFVLVLLVTVSVMDTVTEPEVLPVTSTGTMVEPTTAVYVTVPIPKPVSTAPVA